ncbi:hypothetical protein SNE35_12880 [Paucibacter sp. R3-3]|uniref:Uncharacterized protein n=1 Tax=Roseateles agri TaxID=3098619 RepID=A0ABU5DJI7_9BURK|nr:hypothetical protein [Paucibacter sp. R3-3]MDY0745409.1 hypothetical protein [Paucibacter sp. R3-3]
MAKDQKPKPPAPSKPAQPASPADDPPIAPPEGGRRSDLDGKFEADHRPSR